jgi:hypothetical protein
VPHEPAPNQPFQNEPSIDAPPLEETVPSDPDQVV